MGRELADELVVADGERGRIDVAALHREEADPGEVTAREPSWADAWSGLGWTLAKGGDRVEAERSFRRSLAVQPGYADAVRGLQELGKRP